MDIKYGNVHLKKLYPWDGALCFQLIFRVSWRRSPWLCVAYPMGCCWFPVRFAPSVHPLFLGGFSKTLNFKQPQWKKSGAVMSGEQAGQGISLFLQIKQPGNFSRSIKMLVVWIVAPSRWNHVSSLTNSPRSGRAKFTNMSANRSELTATMLPFSLLKKTGSTTPWKDMAHHTVTCSEWRGLLWRVRGLFPLQYRKFCLLTHPLRWKIASPLIQKLWTSSPSWPMTFKNDHAVTVGTPAGKHVEHQQQQHYQDFCKMLLWQKLAAHLSNATWPLKIPAVWMPKGESPTPLEPSGDSLAVSKSPFHKITVKKCLLQQLKYSISCCHLKRIK